MTKAIFTVSDLKTTRPERRSHIERRQQADRRDTFRFELEKTPRRSGHDRRKDSEAWSESGLLQ